MNHKIDSNVFALCSFLRLISLISIQRIAVFSSEIISDKFIYIHVNNFQFPLKQKKIS